MVKPRTIESRTAIIGECRTNHAAVADHGIVRLVVISAIVSRRITTAVIGRRVTAIVPVAGTIGVGGRGQSADYCARDQSAGSGRDGVKKRCSTDTWLAVSSAPAPTKTSAVTITQVETGFLTGSGQTQQGARLQHRHRKPLG